MTTCVLSEAQIDVMGEPITAVRICLSPPHEPCMKTWQFLKAQQVSL